MKQTPQLLKKHWLSVFCTIIAIVASLYFKRNFESPPVPETDAAPELPVVTQTEPSISRPPETAPQSQAPSSVTTAPQPTTKLPVAEAPELLAFRAWLNLFTQLSPEQQATALPEGIALAKERRAVMRELIRNNPEAALQQALRFDEWESLPLGVRAEVERPFSETVNYKLFPVCPGPGSAPNDSPTAQKPLIEVQLGNGEVVNGFVYGGRAAIISKQGLPTQGITLDGVAALRDGVFQPLGTEEAAVAGAKFPAGQQDTKRSFVTGEPIAGQAVTALAGGKRFIFASTEELTKFDAAIAKLDAKPGPYAGSRAIFSLPYSPDATSGNINAFNLQAAEMQAVAAANDWTSTPKKMFLIRTTISGTSNTSLVSKTAAETVINGTSNAGTAASSLFQFSYGNTYVTATVSSGTYELPYNASYYAGTLPSVGSGTYTSKMSTLLEDARTKFRTTKSGGDATINIGTLATVGVLGGDLGDYDIVGVTFVDIGCYSNGVKLAGLASVGGGDFWMQGNNDAEVYVHEMGHVYGLGHSNFWQVNPGTTSAVGAGAEKEYGDPYDVMGSGTLPNGHFHPQAKQKLGWISIADSASATTPQWQNATALGSNLYRIYQIDSELTTGALRGVRLTKGTSGADSEYYWIGYRPTNTDNQHLTQGAYLLWERYPSLNSQDKCMLIDTTPLTSGTASLGSTTVGKADSGLDVGRTYSDIDARVHITPVGYGGSGYNKYLDVQIYTGTLSSGSCTASISAGTATFYARSATTFTANATSSTGATLAYFWDAGDGTVTGGSGASAATFSYAYTAGGTYTLKLSVSDMKGATASGSLVLNVTDPAQSFTKRNNSTGADINAVAASPTLIVAVGDNGSGAGSNVIRTSPDGIVWTERTVAESTLNLELNSIIWDGTRFIAVGQDYNYISAASGILYGVIYTSETGLVWKRSYATSQDNTALNTVCSGKGIILAAGNSGTVLRSADGGASWFPVSDIPSITSGSMSCRGLAFGSDFFVLTAKTATSSNGKGGIITYSGSGVVCASSTGATGTWTNQTSGAGFSSTYQDFQKIAYLNGKFITSGWLSGLKTGIFTNGTLTFSTSRSDTDIATVLGYASGLYFASGSTQTPFNLYSTDGGTWKTATPKTGMEYQNDGVFFNNRLVSVGSLGAIYQSGTLATSNNAPIIGSLVAQTTRSARIPITLVVSATDADGDALSYRWDAGDGIHSGTSSVFTNTYATGGTYSVSVTVNDGRGGSVTSGTSLVVSDPAKAFTLVSGGSATASGTVTLNGIASSGSLAVAVGDNGKVVTSADGKTWTDHSLSSPENLYLQAITWDGTRFIAVGLDYKDGWVGVILTSTNGTSWNKKYPLIASSDFFNAFRSVASSGGTLLVGGDSGRLLRSTDGGSNWSAVSSGALSIPSDHSVTGLAYGSSTFVATSHSYNDSSASGDGRTYTSPDGSIWNIRTPGSGLTSSTDLNSIAYLNDRFVGSGWYSKLRVSTDNGATFTTTQSARELTPALAYGGGVYLTAGVDLDAGNAKVHTLSSDGSTWTQFPAPDGVASENAATFFNNTFLIAGESGQIWQSGAVTGGGGTLEILSQPSALTINEGTEATFSVLAVGGGTLSYQWKKNGTSISSGGTNSSFTLPSTATTDSGSYCVQITDSATSTSLTSGSVALLVNAVSLQSGSLVSIQPPSNVALVKGSEATLAVTLFAPDANVSQTTYTLYSGTATALAVSGSVSTSGVAYIPLKSLTDSGSYSVRFERASPAGRIYDFSQPFNVTFTTWDSAAGTYQTLLANGSAAATALNDGSIYRGFLNLTVNRFGSVSGRLYYNEATLLSGGTSGERLYSPITRSFSGKFVPQAGTPSTMTLTPSKLGTAAQSLRESLTIELDLSTPPAKMKATLTDSVSLGSGSCISSATDVTKVSSGLTTGDLTGLVGKYLLAANVTNNTATYEQQAYIQTQVLSNGRLLWNSRLKGHAGTGTTFLNTNDATAPFAGLYEGSQVTNTKLHNAYSLLGEVGFQLNAGSWAASIGSPELENKMEKQASYVARQTTDSGSPAAVYNSAYFSSGTNFTGVKHVSFGDNNRARWSGATFNGIPAFLPTAQTLTLSLQDPVNSSAEPLRWAVSVESSGVVTTIPQTTGGVPAPNISLRFTKATGLWSGVYILSGARRTLVGATIDQGTAAATRAAQGWAESGSVPNIKTGSWTISK